jgi:hypothetical protein
VNGEQGRFPDSGVDWGSQSRAKERDEEYRLKTEKNGYFLDEVISALTKEIRRGNEDAALYWALELVQGGFAKYFWTRMSVLVAEEIGLADPFATVFLNACAQCYERRIKKWSEGPHTTELVGQLILYLCRVPKSHEAAMAAYAVEEERNAGRRDPVPEYAVDMHTRAGREKMAREGMGKKETALWFWKVLWKITPAKPGNRWIRRMVKTETDLGDASDEVYREYLQDYGESDENQL